MLTRNDLLNRQAHLEQDLKNLEANLHANIGARQLIALLLSDLDAMENLKVKIENKVDSAIIEPMDHEAKQALEALEG
jgi:hypothetical protein